MDKTKIEWYRRELAKRRKDLIQWTPFLAKPKQWRRFVARLIRELG